MKQLRALLLTLFCILPAAAQPKDAWKALGTEGTKQAYAFAEDYKRWIGVARTSRTSVRESLAIARRAGFVDGMSATSFKAGTKLYFSNRGLALILAIAGKQGPSRGLRIVGTHIDSPHIDLKSRPLYQSGRFGMLQTNYHGGIKRYQWVNRPLALIGTIVRKDGTLVEISIGLGADDPVLVIPDLAPHVDRSYRNRKQRDVIKGEELDPIAWHLGGKQARKFLLAHLAKTYKISEDDLVSAALELVPATRVRDVGLDRALVGAYGQDDRSLSYTALRGITDAGIGAHTGLAYLTDNEETGSINTSGARSRWFQQVVGKLLALELGRSPTVNQLQQTYSRSQMISADATTGLNPIFPGPQEKGNASRVSGGVVVKMYGRGSNAPPKMIASMRKLMDDAGIPWQVHTYKVGVGGGGTIGQFFTRLNIEVIDMGIGLLSMHAPYELSSKADLYLFYQLCSRFLRR